MEPKVGQYHYVYRGNSYVIYRCERSTEKGCLISARTDEPVFRDREQARKRVYELNGWRSKK